MSALHSRHTISVICALLAAGCGSAIEGANELSQANADTSQERQALGDTSEGDVHLMDDEGVDAAQDEDMDVALEGDLGPEASQVCPPGLSGCVEGNLLICNEDGSAFELVKCDSWLVCWEGECITCVESTDCTEGAICEDGECIFLDLAVKTTELAPALQGLPYVFELEGEGGIPPYTWSIHQGDLPDGFSLSSGGVISGMSDEAGPSPLLIKLRDSNGDVVVEPLSLVIEEHGLYITSPSQ